MDDARNTHKLYQANLHQKRCNLRLDGKMMCRMTQERWALLIGDKLRRMEMDREQLGRRLSVLDSGATEEEKKKRRRRRSNRSSPTIGKTESSKTVVPKVCSTDPKGSATSSQGTRGYISVIATLKFDILLKIIAELFNGRCVFRTTVKVSNKETPCAHQASDNQ
jgi:hypothetical protein